jgi:putative component of membrane protein insertase Oxa1/YidC/SpoIIIJ protein YidD
MGKIYEPKKVSTAILLCMLTLAACAHTAERNNESTVKTANPFYEGILKIYTGPLNHLRSVRRGECPMYPSCSEYSRQAIAHYGFAKGWVMAMDRLMRCGRDEMRLAPRILVNGKWRYYDPIESNDLWRSKSIHSTGAASSKIDSLLSGVFRIFFAIS